MKAPSPVLGFNNNVRHKGRVFHIQTEDSGVRRPHIITHLFADGGRILKTTKTSYAEHVGEAALTETVRGLMKEQHKAMFIALRDGQFDHLLDESAAAPSAAPAPPPPRSTPATSKSPFKGTLGGPKSAKEPPVSFKGRNIALPVVPPPAPSRPGSSTSSALDALLSKAPASSAEAPAPQAAAPEPPAPEAAALEESAPEAAALEAAALEAAALEAAALEAAALEAAALEESAPEAAALEAAALEAAALEESAPEAAALEAAALEAAALEAAALEESAAEAAALELQDPAPAARPPPSPIPPPPPSRGRPRFDLDQAALAAPVDRSNAHAAGVVRRMTPLGTPPSDAGLDLDLDALERAAAEAETPFFQQIQDLPPPPAAVVGPKPPPAPAPLRRSADASPRATAPAIAAAALQQGSPSAGRYALSRPAAIFSPARPAEGASIFGEDLISEKSLDEVILSYLAEDLDTPSEE